MNYADIKIGIGIPKYRDFHDSLISFASALSQNKENTEIGISDNNAAPEQYFLCNIANHPNCIYSKNKYNVGALKNFILAYNMVSTRYFTWLADDDCLSPGFTDTIINSIKNSKKGVVAWAGIPTSFTSHTALNRIGKFFPNINGSPVARLKKCSIFGKYNFPFYSVFDRNIVSIKPLAKIADLWPAPLDGIDWAWSYYICLLGEIETIQSQLYLYRMDNWIDNTNKSALLNQYRPFLARVNTLSGDDCGNVNKIIAVIHVNRVLFTFALIAIGLDEFFCKNYSLIPAQSSTCLLHNIFWWLYSRHIHPLEVDGFRVLSGVSKNNCNLNDALAILAHYMDSSCTFEAPVLLRLNSILSDLSSKDVLSSLRQPFSLSPKSLRANMAGCKLSAYQIKATTLISQFSRLHF